MKDYSANLDQASRLALCPVSEFVDIREDDGSDVLTLSSPPNGFKMPSIQAIREHDASLSLQSRPSFAMDDEQDEESEDEALASETAYKRRDAMREHSFRLPSQSSRRECLAEMKALGLAWSE